MDAEPPKEQRVDPAMAPGPGVALASASLVLGAATWWIAHAVHPAEQIENLILGPIMVAVGVFLFGLSIFLAISIGARLSEA